MREKYQLKEIELNNSKKKFNKSKKNLEKQRNKVIYKDFSVKRSELTSLKNLTKNFNQSSYLFRKKISKFNKYTLKRQQIVSYLRFSCVGRPYKQYKFLLSKNYLSLDFVVRPNNVFALLKDVTSHKQRFSNKVTKNYQIIKEKKSSDYGIKFTKKGIKSKTLSFLKQFLQSLRYLKIYKYGFIVVNILTPKNLRKKVLELVSKSFLSKRFKNKKVILNIKHKKVYNGCMVCKKRRKKRKKFRLVK